MHETGIETSNRHVATRRFVSIPCTTLKRISTSARVVVRRKGGESRGEKESFDSRYKREYSLLSRGNCHFLLYLNSAGPEFASFYIGGCARVIACAHT